MTTFVLALHSAARADAPCEVRATELNDSFAAEYIALETECYPAEPQTFSTNDGEFNVSPECQAKYEQLNARLTTAWEELYAACPDLPRPRANNFRAPTKQELLDRINRLKHRLSRARAKQRILARQCRR
jgi:hypothetical protein